MLILVTYDVSVIGDGGPKRLRNIAKICQDFGVRVQNSVFECEVNPAQFEFLKDKLFKIYDAKEDSIRFYLLGKKGRQRVEHFGAKQVQDISTDALLF